MFEHENFKVKPNCRRLNCLNVLLVCIQIKISNVTRKNDRNISNNANKPKEKILEAISSLKKRYLLCNVRYLGKTKTNALNTLKTSCNLIKIIN